MGELESPTEHRNTSPVAHELTITTDMPIRRRIALAFLILRKRRVDITVTGKVKR